jgi:hypothetical protein
MTELPVIHHRGQLVDARLHLLDRQLLDDEDSPAGIVDDLVLSGVELDKDIPEGTEAPHFVAVGSRGGYPHFRRRTAPIPAAGDSAEPRRFHPRGREAEADGHGLRCRLDGEMAVRSGHQAHPRRPACC